MKKAEAMSRIQLRHVSDEEIKNAITQLENKVKELTYELRWYTRERTRRNELRRNGHQIDRDVTIFNLREGGKTYTEIALEIGISPNRVRQIYHKVERQKRFDAKHGLPSRYD